MELADNIFSRLNIESTIITGNMNFILKFAYIFAKDNCIDNKINNMANIMKVTLVNIYWKLDSKSLQISIIVSSIIKDKVFKL